MPTTRPRTLSPIEPLESRIAPASITFTDVDGISVKITASKGSVADLQAVAILAAEGSGQELRELRLSDLPDVFQGANISIVKGTLSDTQFVDIGFINATGLDLGKITVDGDLGRIVAGDSNSVTAAAKDLTVGSFGVQGLATQEAGGTLVSKFVGRLASLAVNGDFKDASLTVLGIDPDPDENVSTAVDARGDIGDIFIGGNLIGGADARTGFIYSKGSIGNITIVGSVLGGAGDFSGAITSERNMGKVDIGGDVRGGTISGAAVSDFSGRIFSAGGMGSVKLGGALRGGDGAESGNISSAGVLGNVTIAQGIFGGLGRASGAVGTGGDIGKITVTGGILGGGGEQSGSILSVGDMKAVHVTGDITGGSQFNSGIIAASGNVANVVITGSILGGSGTSSGAVGSSQNMASVTVTGSLTGGTGLNSGAIGCFGKLGPVSIGGDFVGGDQFGSGRIAAGVSIAKVTINGSFTGGNQTEAGSILAPKIGNLSVGVDMTGGDGFRAGFVAADTIGNVSIGRDLKGGDGTESGKITATQSMGNVNITGSLIGGDGFSSGGVSAEFFDSKGMVERAAAAAQSQSIGNVKIGGSIEGGSSNRTGSIYSTGSIGSVTVGGDVIGGSSFNSGTILADENIGPVKITGSLKGDVEAGNSGRIRAFGKLASVNIGGDVIGGGSFYGDSTEGEDFVAGQISSGDAMGSVIIGGSLKGGNGSNSATIYGGSIKSVLINGNIEEGSGFQNSSIIASKGNLSSLTVKGAVNLTQNVFSESANRIVFGAADSIGSATFGDLNGTGGFTEGLITAVNSIGKVTVEGSAKFFKILAGYDINGQPVNSAAKINKVVIGTTGDGNIQGVDIAAGVTANDPNDTSGEGDTDFGTSNDSPIRPFTAKAVSRIASVIIKGNVLATPQSFQHHGIVAGQIDFVKIHGETLPLTSRLDVIDVATFSGPGPVVLGNQGLNQFTVREVSFATSTAP